jgi:hypothetical protein
VAFESLIQRTPSLSPSGSRRCGSGATGVGAGEAGGERGGEGVHHVLLADEAEVTPPHE